MEDNNSSSFRNVLNRKSIDKDVLDKINQYDSRSEKSNKSNNSKPEITKEFVEKVKKIIELDIELEIINQKKKELTLKKKEYEQFIVNYMKNEKIDVLKTSGGRKLQLKQKTQMTTISKKYVTKKLTEIFSNEDFFNDIMEQINVEDKVKMIIHKIWSEREKNIDFCLGK